ncbi:MAG TPA: hypoxanthine-guanine phosphoribosyltransferase, partial [Burkholderiales bacterium]|nr:hypoxanthine-guanine phosphoribosyltransferase [Burkholderiales bacterium]
MLDKNQAWQVLREADLVCSEQEIDRAVERIAAEVTAKLVDANPLVLSVMGGAVVFTGRLLPLLHFPLQLDYLHVTRYDGKFRGSEVRWKAGPRTDIRGRTLLVVDDILDEGDTLAAVRERLLADGAAAFFSAVFADKDIGRAKPIRADFVGVRVPDRYVFGFGMDI